MAGANHEGEGWGRDKSTKALSRTPFEPVTLGLYFELFIFSYFTNFRRQMGYMYRYHYTTILVTLKHS